MIKNLSDKELRELCNLVIADCEDNCMVSVRHEAPVLARALLSLLDKSAQAWEAAAQVCDNRSDNLASHGSIMAAVEAKKCAWSIRQRALMNGVKPFQKDHSIQTCTGDAPMPIRDFDEQAARQRYCDDNFERPKCSSEYDSPLAKCVRSSPEEKEAIGNEIGKSERQNALLTPRTDAFLDEHDEFLPKEFDSVKDLIKHARRLERDLRSAATVIQAARKVKRVYSARQEDYAPTVYESYWEGVYELQKVLLSHERQEKG